MYLVRTSIAQLEQAAAEISRCIWIYPDHPYYQGCAIAAQVHSCPNPAVAVRVSAPAEVQRVAYCIALGALKAARFACDNNNELQRILGTAESIYAQFFPFANACESIYMPLLTFIKEQRRRQ